MWKEKRRLAQRQRLGGKALPRAKPRRISAYYPTHWNTIETENAQLRQAAIKVFAGEKPLKVKIADEPEPLGQIALIPPRR